MSRTDLVSVVAALYALDEPWRSRFLVLTAKLATRWRWDGQVPERDEVGNWLRTQPGLRRLVAELLWVWTGQYLEEEKENEP